MLATHLAPGQYRVRGQFTGRVPMRGSAGCAGAVRGGATGPSRGGGRPAKGPGDQRNARLTAETTAFSEARVVLGSMPMPHSTRPSMAHSMYEAAWADAPSLSVCSL